MSVPASEITRPEASLFEPARCSIAEWNAWPGSRIDVARLEWLIGSPEPEGEPDRPQSGQALATDT